MSLLRWLWAQTSRPRRWQLRWLSRVLGLAALAGALWASWPAVLAGVAVWLVTTALFRRAGEERAWQGFVLGLGLAVLAGLALSLAGASHLAWLGPGLGLVAALADRRAAKKPARTG